jgi:hypothetical protein
MAAPSATHRQRSEAAVQSSRCCYAPASMGSAPQDRLLGGGAGGGSVRDALHQPGAGPGQPPEPRKGRADLAPANVKEAPLNQQQNRIIHGG